MSRLHLTIWCSSCEVKLIIVFHYTEYIVVRLKNKYFKYFVDKISNMAQSWIVVLNDHASYQWYMKSIHPYQNECLSRSFLTQSKIFSQPEEVRYYIGEKLLPGPSWHTNLLCQPKTIDSHESISYESLKHKKYSSKTKFLLYHSEKWITYERICNLNL